MPAADADQSQRTEKQEETTQISSASAPSTPPAAVAKPMVPGATAGPSLYPERDWFATWKASLNLQNVKACISHTYNKAMHIRN